MLTPCVLGCIKGMRSGDAAKEDKMKIYNGLGDRFAHILIEDDDLGWIDLYLDLPARFPW